jgi:hypothetical protein
MTTTITTEDLANVPHPAGAVQVHEWFNDDQPVGAVVDHVYEGTRRWFVGISRLVSCPDVPDIKVWIDGFQYADGHADRYIMVDNVHTDHPLPPGVLRDLIAALTAVADEVDLMASHDQDTV